ncbi:hypothetical protein JTE90_005908 [Oedothorax gibbosus]|uniref:MHD domain-containing protein n=1 Tax=Oedothorax gibbosus TaxID=931172 RepID=A0AAV6U9Y6_9ARAC|nr:hypothetical protein JTE90_005908 [Oedothorax gibbosus]
MTNCAVSPYAFGADWQSYWNSWGSGFLKSKRDKRKEKKKKKINGTREDSSVTSGDANSQDRVPTSPQIDAEGFTIRPQERNAEYMKDTFYSSSDNDSDVESSGGVGKIIVKIKPVSSSPGMSASIDELIATVGAFSLSPDPQRMAARPASSAASTPEDGPLKRSISMSNTLNKVEGDVFSPSASSASTPTGPPTAFPPSPPNSSPPSDNSLRTGGSKYSSSAFETSSEVEPELANNSSEVPRPALPNSRGGTPTSSILPPHVLPRPPSRRAFEATLGSRGRMSPLPMTRAESIGSLDFKTTSMPVGSSRGPSPLTIGMGDTIPLAVAFSEVVNACFKGTDETRCQVRLVGDMKVSFPAGIVQVLANNPSPANLVFRLSKASKLDNILPNKQLITLDSSQSTREQYVYEFNMQALTALLRKQFEQTPTASYFNIDILKYQVRCLAGARSTPLHLVSYWKCSPTSTDLRVDYKYNVPSLTPSTAPLSSVTIIVPVNGGVTEVQSKPKLAWNADTGRAMWKLPDLPPSSGQGLGSLRAHFELGSGPSSPCALAAQFVCNNASLSGVDFELVGLGYRLSLVKKQVVAGKYLCESEPVANSYP